MDRKNILNKFQCKFSSVWFLKKKMKMKIRGEDGWDSITRKARKWGTGSNMWHSTKTLPSMAKLFSTLWIMFSSQPNTHSFPRQVKGENWISLMGSTQQMIQAISIYIYHNIATLAYQWLANADHIAAKWAFDIHFTIFRQKKKKKIYVVTLWLAKFYVVEVFYYSWCDCEFL